MEGGSDGITPLLWVWLVVLLPLVLDRLCAVQLRRLRSLVPLLLLLGGIWLSATVFDLVLRCQDAVNNWAPLQSLEQALHLHTS